ncbi:MAG: BolA family transcriptional regulator [Hyphomicrobiales bacterium]|nr:BolA family transcriptional regulator [Hyphomicrobiales bacterium]MCY4049681.1 BolA family transcriptional regulator [Hyphomicrobiales bacterium]MCY4052979.1 BolA family transcriptional regulator [Hyphomicrobiales bacterium]
MMATAALATFDVLVLGKGMPVSDAEAFLRKRLCDDLAPQELEIVDESHRHIGHAGANASGVGTHFRVRIVAGAFKGLSRVQRHRLVYRALQDDDSGALGCGIHALELIALSSVEESSEA